MPLDDRPVCLQYPQMMAGLAHAEVLALRDMDYPPLPEDGLLRVLVTGGSQGARVLSEVGPDGLSMLQPALRFLFELLLVTSFLIHPYNRSTANEEFRRRIKTQTVLPCAETVPGPSAQNLAMLSCWVVRVSAIWRRGAVMERVTCTRRRTP